MVRTRAGAVVAVVLGMSVSLCFLYILLSNNYFTSHNFEVDKPRIQMEIIKNDGWKNELIPVPDCNCSRRNHYYLKGQTQKKRLMSSCSDPGTFFEPSQKVVSYSLHLPKCSYPKKCDDRRSLYLQGILENLRTIRQYYPTYTMRVYTDVRGDPQFCSIICNNSDLFWCDIRASPMHRNRNLSQVFFMVWRFLPLGDPTVDLFLSRDLDSIIIEREAAVVADWLSLPEKKAIHVMRDIIVHHHPILGGMWGANNSLLGGSTNQSAASLLTSMLNAGMDTKRHKWGFDQDILKSVIFYPLKKNIVAYDSVLCEDWRNYTLVRPFPIKRKNHDTDFVGNVDFGKRSHSHLIVKCPVSCRPEYGKDWEWC